MHDGFYIPEFPGEDRKPNQRKRYLQPVVDHTADDILLNQEGSISKKERIRKNIEEKPNDETGNRGLKLNLEKLPEQEEYDDNSYR